MNEQKRRGRPPKKKWVIRCGGGENWLTEIREAQSGHPRIYVYGSKDVNDAMRFTEDEARELAERRHAEAVKIE